MNSTFDSSIYLEKINHWNPFSDAGKEQAVANAIQKLEEQNLSIDRRIEIFRIFLQKKKDVEEYEKSTSSNQNTALLNLKASRIDKLIAPVFKPYQDQNTSRKILARDITHIKDRASAQRIVHFYLYCKTQFLLTPISYRGF